MIPYAGKRWIATLAIAVAALAPSAYARDGYRLMGAKDCRIVNTTDFADLTATWTGGCRNGFADGPGVLEWHVKKGRVFQYLGEMREGLRHGQGYVEFVTTVVYEGSFVKGEMEGKGSWRSWRHRYDGDFKAGKRDGHGKITYAFGGEYEGGFKNDEFHGKGTARYRSGRVVTGEWVNGTRVDRTEVKESTKEEKLQVFNSRTSMRDTLATGVVSFNKNYEELSPEEKRTIRSIHGLLDDDDEPPYPIGGTKALMEAIYEAANYYVKPGSLVLLVDVDETGKASKISVVSSPSRDVTRYVAAAALKQKFKPALCAGKPCASKYELAANLDES